MIFSTRSEYGVMMLTVLARHYGEAPLSLTEIAVQLNPNASTDPEEPARITVAYLEQIVPALRHHGLIESQRGAKGGYVLTTPPENVRMGAVIRALEERKDGKNKLGVMPCANLDGSTDPCGLSDICTGPLLWTRVRDAITQALDATTLADLMPDTRQRLPLLRKALAGFGLDQSENEAVNVGVATLTSPGGR